MKNAAAFLCSFIALISCAFADEEMPLGDITLAGRVYTSAKIVRTTPSDATISHKSGIITVPIATLPKSLQERLGYREDISQIYQKQQAERRARLTQERAKSQARKTLADAFADAPEMRFTLLQILTEEGGALAELREGGGLAGSAASAMSRLSGRSTAIIPPTRTEVFIQGPLPPDAVDGSTFTAKAIEAGSYTLETFNGPATLRKLRIANATLTQR